LRRALLVSLACHGVLLLWGDVLQITALAPAGGGNLSLQARLQAPGVEKGPASGAASGAATGAVPDARQRVVSPREAQTSPVSPHPVVPTEAPRILAVPGVAPEVLSPARASGGRESIVHGGAAAGSALVGTVAAGGGGEGAAAPALPPVREGASGDALRQYRLALALEARRFKRYPRLARERAWEGSVEVAVRLGSGPAVASLERSSGYGLLDDQGLEMVRQALAVTPVPEALRGREWRLVFPIQFSLEE